jgi:ADP-ribose pyrophosphatase YjhB (NUDIX family)
VSSNDTIWKPHVTVAAIIEREGRFHLVEEETDEGLRFNQPAGHLEPDESLLDAVRREALEETACAFEPRALVGVYHYQARRSAAAYVRFAFCGEAGGPIAGRALDIGIVRTVWLTPDEVAACASRHRTPLVAQGVQDYLLGRRYPLDLVVHNGRSA